MRILLVLTCCFGLALFARAAQPDDAGDHQGKKKGGGNAPAQQVTTAPQTGKVYKTGPHTGTANYNLGNKKTKWQGPVTGQTQTNVAVDPNNPNIHGNGNAAYKTKLGKAKFSSQANATGGNVKFQKQHFNLQTNKVVNKYKTVNFNGNYKIAGAQKWKGAKYQVFVNYQPQWHDTWWWNWHHPHVVFIYGGWYYWDNSYWYPAWGYAPNSVYYYDGPIYASSPQEDPAQVVANVQSALQQQGY